MVKIPWLDRAAYLLLRLSVAIIFIWFGLLKAFGQCPLGDFVCRTLPFLPSDSCLLFLGWWEVSIGLCLLFRPFLRIGLIMLLIHLGGTALPFVVLPEECFARSPFVLTVQGQYIVKNLTLASAALVIASRIGARVASDDPSSSAQLRRVQAFHPAVSSAKVNSSNKATKRRGGRSLKKSARAAASVASSSSRRSRVVAEARVGGN